MKISIVTATLNSAKYLRETIDSIQAAFRGLEVEHIIVDGGSTDGTRELADPRFSKILLLPGASMYEAIDHGFAHSTGGLLGWLNSDDRYCPDTGTILMRLLHDHPSAKIVSGSCWYIDEHGRRLFPKHFLMRGKMFLNSFDSLRLCQPSTFWTREVYETLGGLDLSYRVVSDRDFLLRAINAYGLLYTTRALSEFRIHGFNKSIVESALAARENAAINARLNVGPTTLSRKLVATTGHYLNAAFNPRMIAWKLMHGKTKI